MPTMAELKERTLAEVRQSPERSADLDDRLRELYDLYFAYIPEHPDGPFALWAMALWAKQTGRIRRGSAQSMRFILSRNGLTMGQFLESLDLPVYFSDARTKRRKDQTPAALAMEDMREYARWCLRTGFSLTTVGYGQWRLLYPSHRRPVTLTTLKNVTRLNSWKQLKEAALEDLDV